MPTNSKQNSPNNDEIDLLTLFTKLGEFTKKAFLGLVNLLGSVLVFLLRKWYYFGIAAILTVISALILSNAIEPHYSSDMVLKSNATTNQPIMSSLNKLGKYASAGNFEALSEELNLSVEDASKLKGLETFWYFDIGKDGIYDGLDIEGRYLSDTAVDKVEDEFVVRVSITDPETVKRIEEGLKYCLESNSFLDALNKQRLSGLEARINQTQYEIEKLDSLQKREYYTNTEDLRQQEGQIVFTSEKISKTYHNDMFNLLRIKQEYETDLNIYSDVVTIIEGFSMPVQPDNGTLKYAVKLMWYYLGLAIFLSLIITYRDKIKDFNKSK